MKKYSQMSDNELLASCDNVTEYDFEQATEICKRCGYLNNWMQLSGEDSWEDLLEKCIEKLKK